LLGSGAYLSNQYSTIAAPVFVYSSTAINNKFYGIQIESAGSVVLDGVSANANRGSASTDGIYINNSFGTGDVSINSTKGVNNFNNNTQDGVYIQTLGNITLSKVTANGNGSNGIYAVTTGTGKYFNSTNVNARGNYNNGINGYASANSTFTNVKVYNNGVTTNQDGIYMYLTSGNDFTISSSTITGNGRYGAYAVLGGSNAFKLISTYFFGNDHYNGSLSQEVATSGLLQIS
jgi:hypothetical protein